ncbi:MAG: hypothetical protein ACI8R9_002000 [Paraglaciecola sp.]|jgi:hypothetical protein
MNTLSGLKAIDNLIEKYGIGFEQADNPFQSVLCIPPGNNLEELREAITPFGLKTFPHVIWLKLSTAHLEESVYLHQFRLPQLDGRVFCWVLVTQQGCLLEFATEINKLHYLKAAKYLSRLITHHPHASRRFHLTYG